MLASMGANEKVQESGNILSRGPGSAMGSSTRESSRREMMEMQAIATEISILDYHAHQFLVTRLSLLQEIYLQEAKEQASNLAMDRTEKPVRPVQVLLATAACNQYAESFYYMKIIQDTIGYLREKLGSEELPTDTVLRLRLHMAKFLCALYFYWEEGCKHGELEVEKESNRERRSSRQVEADLDSQLQAPLVLTQSWLGSYMDCSQKINEFQNREKSQAAELKTRRNLRLSETREASRNSKIASAAAKERRDLYQKESSKQHIALRCCNGHEGEGYAKALSILEDQFDIFGGSGSGNENAEKGEEEKRNLGHSKPSKRNITNGNTFPVSLSVLQLDLRTQIILQAGKKSGSKGISEALSKYFGNIPEDNREHADNDSSSIGKNVYGHLSYKNYAAMYNKRRRMFMALAAEADPKLFPMKLEKLQALFDQQAFERQTARFLTFFIDTFLEPPMFVRLSNQSISSHANPHHNNDALLEKEKNAFGKLDPLWDDLLKTMHGASLDGQQRGKENLNEEDEVAKILGSFPLNENIRFPFKFLKDQLPGVENILDQNSLFLHLPLSENHPESMNHISSRTKKVVYEGSIQSFISSINNSPKTGMDQEEYVEVQDLSSSASSEGKSKKSKVEKEADAEELEGKDLMQDSSVSNAIPSDTSSQVPVQPLAPIENTLEKQKTRPNNDHSIPQASVLNAISGTTPSQISVQPVVPVQNTQEKQKTPLNNDQSLPTESVPNTVPVAVPSEILVQPVIPARNYQEKQKTELNKDLLHRSSSTGKALSGNVIPHITVQPVVLAPSNQEKQKTELKKDQPRNSSAAKVMPNNVPPQISVQSSLPVQTSQEPQNPLAKNQSNRRTSVPKSLTDSIPSQISIQPVVPVLDSREKQKNKLDADLLNLRPSVTHAMSDKVPSHITAQPVVIVQNNQEIQKAVVNKDLRRRSSTAEVMSDNIPPQISFQPVVAVQIIQDKQNNQPDKGQLISPTSSEIISSKNINQRRNSNTAVAVLQETHPTKNLHNPVSSMASKEDINKETEKEIMEEEDVSDNAWVPCSPLAASKIQSPSDEVISSEQQKLASASPQKENLDGKRAVKPNQKGEKENISLGPNLLPLPQDFAVSSNLSDNANFHSDSSSSIPRRPPSSRTSNGDKKRSHSEKESESNPSDKIDESDLQTPSSPLQPVSRNAKNARILLEDRIDEIPSSIAPLTNTLPLPIHRDEQFSQSAPLAKAPKTTLSVKRSFSNPNSSPESQSESEMEPENNSFVNENLRSFYTLSSIPSKKNVRSIGSEHYQQIERVNVTIERDSMINSSQNSNIPYIHQQTESSIPRTPQAQIFPRHSLPNSSNSSTSPYPSQFPTPTVHPNALRSPPASAPRGARMFFSEQETANLIDGVLQFGNRWGHILSVYEFHPNRTSVDLKDKARNLKKKGLLPM